MFAKSIVVRMYDTDAAGVIFFGNQFRMAHAAYEEFMDELGWGFARLIETENFFVPIVHTEADYFKPLAVGMALEIRLHVQAIGESSFTVDYDFFDSTQQCVGTVKTVHVTVDKATHKKIPIPSELRRILQKHLKI